MSIKLVVLYPQPSDPALFEQLYHAQHMPLMHQLIVPNERVPTFKVVGPEAAPFYRMAEIHFADLAELSAFAASEGGKRARSSSQHVSSGGKPIVLLCQADAPAGRP